MQHTLMVHVFLKSPSGLVKRSRFWIGALLRPYAPANLATLLPELHERHGG